MDRKTRRFRERKLREKGIDYVFAGRDARELIRSLRALEVCYGLNLDAACTAAVEMLREPPFNLSEERVPWGITRFLIDMANDEVGDVDVPGQLGDLSREALAIRAAFYLQRFLQNLSLFICGHDRL